ncbi:MAG TPA: FAD:protein FMN transferase [Steroidobacteraceae bacterium]|nr:FAD:protein FMN transferase [Steroidobacteraceae bacterium]
MATSSGSRAQTAARNPFVAAADTPARPWRFDWSAMGCPCEVLVETADSALARRVAEFAMGEAARVDAKFSRYQKGSVVTGLHEQRGRPYRVDDETARLLEYGAALWRISDGAFDLTSGVLRHAWSFDNGRAEGYPEKIPSLLAQVGWQRVRWNPRTREIVLPEGMELDFGGIGKEYAVDRVADWAAANADCPVLVNFGGDLRAIGPAPANGRWVVGIDSPMAPGAAVRRIELRSGALATSGDAARFIEIDGKRYGHILDARTGWPPAGAPRSVTVLAETCSQAGSFSTLAMLRGSGAEDFLRAERVRYWLLGSGN